MNIDKLITKYRNEGYSLKKTHTQQYVMTLFHPKYRKVDLENI